MDYLVRLARIVGAASLFAGCGVLPLTFSKGQVDMPTIAAPNVAVGNASSLNTDARTVVHSDRANIRIYVTTNPAGEIRTHKWHGKLVPPQITGLYGPWGLAVNSQKIFAVNYCSPYSCSFGSGEITTYTLDGTPTTPTITGLKYPLDVAVDEDGKIYVTEQCSVSSCRGGGLLVTYTADGTPTTPTISLSSQPTGVAVARGKIYITQVDNTLTTYTVNGRPAKPTITGLNGPIGVAVDRSGKIFIVNTGSASVNAYTQRGDETTPTITDGLSGPYFVAIDRSGEIFVSNLVGETVTTYKPNGEHIYTMGAWEVAGIAVSP